MAAEAAPRWSGPVLKRLAKLWRDGMSGGDIATALTIQFGTRRTRAAVLGQVRRLGLMGQRAEVSTARAEQRPSLTPPVPMAEAPVSSPEPARPYRLGEIPPLGCRWPVTADKVRPDQHRFCGEICADGKSYCAEHCRRAFVDPRERAEKLRLREMQRKFDAFQPDRPLRAPASRDRHLHLAR